MLVSVAHAGSGAYGDSPSCSTVKPFDIEFWKYQNMLRTNPQAFIPYLNDMKTRFSGNNYLNANNQVYYT